MDTKERQPRLLVIAGFDPFAAALIDREKAGLRLHPSRPLRFMGRTIEGVEE